MVGYQIRECLVTNGRIKNFLYICRYLSFGRVVSQLSNTGVLSNLHAFSHRRRRPTKRLFTLGVDSSQTTGNVAALALSAAASAKK